MTQDEAVRALLLFNEKVDLLSSLSFIKAIRQAGHVFMSAGGGVHKGYPDGEAIQAFVLTFRYFIQNNEIISLGNMAEVYATPGISAPIKAQFDENRRKLNE